AGGGRGLVAADLIVGVGGIGKVGLVAGLGLIAAVGLQGAVGVGDEPGVHLGAVAVGMGLVQAGGDQGDAVGGILGAGEGMHPLGVRTHFDVQVPGELGQVDAGNPQLGSHIADGLGVVAALKDVAVGLHRPGDMARLAAVALGGVDIGEADNGGADDG